MKLTTPHAETVKEAFMMFANLMDVYASDQLASQRWQSKAKDKRDCCARSVVYSNLASDIRSIEFIEETAP